MSSSAVVRTYPSKALIIFLLSVITLSIGICVGVYFIKEVLALKIVIWLFCSIFIVLSIVVLFGEALSYLSISEEKESLVIHKFLRKKIVKFSAIKSVENKDGYYVFMDKHKEFYRIGTNASGVNALMIDLEKRGIKIKWQRF